MALDPQLGTAGHNYLYVLYAYDAAPGQTPPQWNDACPGPPNGPGPTTNGCVVQGRLSRIPVDPATGVVNGPEQVLIGPDWCQQYPSHSIGHLAFGPDGALYASAGDGASFEFVDYGQAGGTVINPNRTAAHLGQPLQRPPGQSRRPQHLPERPRRGAALPEPAPSRERAGSARRHDPAAGPGHRQRPARQSAGLQHQSQRPPDRGDGAAQPLPLHRPARHQRGVGRRRRLEHLGGDRADPVTHRTGDQLRLAMLRGRRPAVRLLGPHPVPGALRRWDESGDCSLLHLQPQRDARVRGHLPDRELIHLGHGLLHRVVLSLLAPRGAVLRRPLAQLHLGDAARHQRPARPEHDRHLHRRRRHQPAGSRRPGGRPRVGDVFFATTTPGWSAGSRPPSRTGRPRRWPRPPARSADRLRSP
jgi:hypothetical protein